MHISQNLKHPDADTKYLYIYLQHSRWEIDFPIQSSQIQLIYAKFYNVKVRSVAISARLKMIIYFNKVFI